MRRQCVRLGRSLEVARDGRDSSFDSRQRSTEGLLQLGSRIVRAPRTQGLDNMAPPLLSRRRDRGLERPIVQNEGASSACESAGSAFGVKHLQAVGRDGHETAALQSSAPSCLVRRRGFAHGVTQSSGRGGVENSKTVRCGEYESCVRPVDFLPPRRNAYLEKRHFVARDERDREALNESANQRAMHPSLGAIAWWCRNTPRPSITCPHATMNRRLFPMGQASASLVKALYRILVDLKGRGAAEAWLRGIGMTPGDIEDETRMLPLETRHRALAAFVSASSREALARLPAMLVSPECIGAWVRTLRAAASANEAFSQLDNLEGDAGGTVRWETRESVPGRWRGRMSIAHDPALEADGLLDIARAAELATVPTLFGWPGSIANAVAAQGGSAPPTLESWREFEVLWPVPHPGWNAGLGASVGVALGALLVVAGIGSWEVDVATMVAMIGAGAGLGLLGVKTRIRRAEIDAQGLRVRALERSLSLKESRERVAPGQIDGLLAGGQYRIVRRMGSGATGVIYEAVRVVDNLPVAVKLLRAVAAHEAVASDRLRREAAALGLSWHPNVVEVVDQGVLPDGTAYMAMELLRGETLAARLRSRRCLTPDEVIPIALEVCDALAAIHADGRGSSRIKPVEHLPRARWKSPRHPAVHAE